MGFGAAKKIYDVGKKIISTPKKKMSKAEKAYKKKIEKEGKIRDKERNKSVAQEIRELKQTGAGKNMTAKQLKDRVMLNRKDAKIPEPKVPGYTPAQRAYAKANKEARQKQIDNAKVSTEKGVKVTKYPSRDKIVKDPTARPRRYLGRGEPIGGMKKGGMLKKPTNPGLKKLPSEVRNKMGYMKHGGSVKGKCRMDGIAIRGRTRAKERSK